MKTLILASCFFSAAAFAALPPARMILERTTENSGTGGYVIEQEVQIPNGAEPLLLKETWTVENDRSMKVTVAPLRDPKDAVKIQIVYKDGQRYILKNGTREPGPLPIDFAERPFHLRSLDAAINFVASLKIVPPRAFDKKPLPKKSEDIKHDGDDFVRLARSNGVITWAFGTPGSATGAEQPPGLWIEQDQFVIRKIRFPSESEITADSFSSYARGLHFPKERTIRWGKNTVSLRTLSVTSKNANVSSSSLDTSWKVQGLENQPAQAVIEEFYTRFR